MALQWNGPAVVRAVKDELARRLKRAAEVQAEAIARAAPKKSGKLAASVTPGEVEESGDRLSVHVDVLAPHAAAVEMGTRLHPATPFIRPAVVASAGQVETILNNG